MVMGMSSLITTSIGVALGILPYVLVHDLMVNSSFYHLCQIRSILYF